MKSPFYKIWLVDNQNGKQKDNQNKDITDYVDSFDYEDCLAEDDMLTLKITTKGFEFLEKKEVAVGKMLNFQFGYLQGLTSVLHQARITDVDTTYADSVSITIKAYDMGTVMKKSKEQVIWKNKKSSEIAKEIAKKYNLQVNVEETKQIFASLPQGSKTDFQFLTYLASIEKNGSFRFYLKDNTLFFNKLDLKKAPKRLFVYQDKNSESNIISFKPSLKETTQQSSGNNAKVASFDPLSGVKKVADVNDKTAKDNTKLGNTVMKYDVNAVKIAGTFNAAKTVKPTETTNSMPSANTSLDHLKNKANKKKKGDSEKVLVATLTIEGDPTLLADEIITMAGVAKMHAGNWYIEKIKHNISSSGYITTLELSKNAINKNGAGGTGTGALAGVPQNQQVGNAKTEEKKVIPKYDVNSKRIN